jgi:hypothetical protein
MKNTLLLLIVIVALLIPTIALAQDDVDAGQCSYAEFSFFSDTNENGTLDDEDNKIRFGIIRLYIIRDDIFFEDYRLLLGTTNTIKYLMCIGDRFSLAHNGTCASMQPVGEVRGINTKFQILFLPRSSDDYKCEDIYIPFVSNGNGNSPGQ